MPVRADAPLRRITLNLYEADAVAMENYYGHGWSIEVRRLVYEHINQRNPDAIRRRTLGDIPSD